LKKLLIVFIDYDFCLLFNGFLLFSAMFYLQFKTLELGYLTGNILLDRLVHGGKYARLHQFGD